MSQAGALGTSSGGGGGGVTTIAGDTGTATGATITVFTSVASQNCGSTVQFTASAAQNLLSVTDPVLLNTFIGLAAGNATLNGIYNVGVGSSVFNALTSGTVNVAVGRACMSSLTTGVGNAAFGANCLQFITSGSNNCCVNSGINYITGTESSNVLLQNNGVNGESNTMRLGDNGGGAGQQTRCFIAGISGVTVANSAAVLIDTVTSQLGTVVSSRRYKEDIQDMNDESSSILTLRPVTFSFKTDMEKNRQFGLIAEEVAEIMPQLVTYNLEGQPETVHYHDLAVLLLNEVIKLSKLVQILREKQ